MNRLALIALLTVLASAGACARHATNVADINATLASAGPTEVVTFKSASCACCGNWMRHMRSAGFRVRAENVEDVSVAKSALGVPGELGSCHTAHVGRYFIEGHVPAEDVKRLIASQLPAKGLAVAGMPSGSPGMAGTVGPDAPFDVLLVGLDGSVTVFAHHGG